MKYKLPILGIITLFFVAQVQAKILNLECGLYSMAGKLDCSTNCLLILNPGSMSESLIDLGNIPSLKEVYDKDNIQIEVLHNSTSAFKADLNKVQRVGANSEFLRNEPSLLKSLKCQR